MSIDTTAMWIFCTLFVIIGLAGVILTTLCKYVPYINKPFVAFDENYPKWRDMLLMLSVIFGMFGITLGYEAYISKHNIK